MLALAMSAAITLSACATSAEEPAGEGNAAPIKIMTIGPVSTTLQSYPDAEIGARAAVEAINAAGGVNAAELEWSFCNTESDPNKAAGCARTATKDGVVAVVGQVDAFTTSSLPVLEAAGIPSFGIHSVGNEIDWVSPVSYPFHGGAPVAHLATASALAQEGVKKVEIVALEVAASTSQIALIEQAIKREGMKVAGSVTIPTSGVSDYAPYAQQLADNDADGAIFLTSAGVATAMVKAAHSLDIFPTFGYNGFSFTETEFLALGDDADGFIVASPYPTFRDTDLPAVVQFNKEIKDAGAGDDPLLRRLVGFNAWLAVHAFAQVAETMDGEITSKTFTETLGSIGELDILGVLTWNPSDLGSANADFPRLPATEERFLSLSDDGELVTRTDLEPVENALAGIKR